MESITNGTGMRHDDVYSYHSCDDDSDDASDDASDENTGSRKTDNHNIDTTTV